MAKKAAANTSTSSSSRSSSATTPASKGRVAASELNADVRMAIVHGPEAFLRDVYTQRLREALTAKFGEVDSVRFDGATANPADILDECRSFGLMAAHKLVTVDNADQLLKAGDDDDETEDAAPPSRKRAAGPAPRTARQLMESYADSPSDGATLLLRAGGWRPGNLDKAVAKVGVVVKCEELRPDEAVRWVQKRAEVRHSTSIAPAAANLLVQTVGIDLGRLDSELAKLALFRPGQPITEPMIAEMVAITREDEFWSIQRVLLSGNPAAALAHLRELVDISRHDAVPLTWSYIELARKLHAVAGVAGQGQPIGPLMGKLRLWGPDGDLVVQAAKRLGVRRAAALLHDAVKTDIKQKSGVGDQIRNLETLTLRFTSVLG